MSNVKPKRPKKSKQEAAELFLETLMAPEDHARTTEKSPKKKSKEKEQTPEKSRERSLSSAAAKDKSVKDKPKEKIKEKEKDKEKEREPKETRVKDKEKETKDKSKDSPAKKGSSSAKELSSSPSALSSMPPSSLLTSDLRANASGGQERSKTVRNWSSFSDAKKKNKDAFAFLSALNLERPPMIPDSGENTPVVRSNQESSEEESEPSEDSGNVSDVSSENLSWDFLSDVSESSVMGHESSAVQLSEAEDGDMTRLDVNQEGSDDEEAAIKEAVERQLKLKRKGSTNTREMKKGKKMTAAAAAAVAAEKRPKKPAKEKTSKPKRRPQVKSIDVPDDFDDDASVAAPPAPLLGKEKSQTMEVESLKKEPHPLLEMLKKNVFLDSIDQIMIKSLLNEEQIPRYFFTTGSVMARTGFPFAIGSLIPHDYEKRKQEKETAAAAAAALSSRLVTSSKGEAKEKVPKFYEGYNPTFLDDPELRTGKHKSVICLPFVLGSIIQYTRASDLKNELNDQFKEAHPDLEPSITLSKIRRLKDLLVEVVAKPDIDLEASTVAIAFVFLEKLILNGFLTKANRKVVTGACLMLAAKTNDPKFVVGQDFYSPLYEEIERILDVSRKSVINIEFETFEQLDFNLHVPSELIISHVGRIISAWEYSNLQEYLGKKSYELFLFSQKYQ